MSIISNSVNRSLSKDVVSSRKQKFRQQKLYDYITIRIRLDGLMIRFNPLLLITEVGIKSLK